VFDAEHWQVVLLSASVAIPMASLIIVLSVIYG